MSEISYLPSKQSINDAILLKITLYDILENSKSDKNDPVFQEMFIKYKELEKEIEQASCELKEYERKTSLPDIAASPPIKSPATVVTKPGQVTPKPITPAPKQPGPMQIVASKTIPKQAEPEEEEIDFDRFDFAGIIEQLNNVAEKNGLFFNLSDKELIIPNLLSGLGIFDERTFDNMTDEQKGAFAFNLGMLEKRSLFLNNEKFVTATEAIKKTPPAPQKILPDVVKQILRDHPDLSMEEKIKLLKKVKTMPFLDENNILVYLTDAGYQDSKRNEFKESATKYFNLLKGNGQIPDQYLCSSGNFAATKGMGGITDGVCRGALMQKTTYYKITNETIAILIKDSTFLQTLETLVPATFQITEEFINSASAGRLRLKNVLTACKNKTFKNKEDFEKTLNNLMPTNSKEEEADKQNTIMFINRNFLSGTFEKFQNISFPTKESLEKELADIIKGNEYIKSKLIQHSATSINDMAINFPENKNLAVSISNWGPDFEDKNFKIEMSVWDINLTFNITNSGIKLADAKSGDEKLDSHELLNHGINIPENVSKKNLIFKRRGIKEESLYIKVINKTGYENSIQVSSNAPIDINLYNVYIENKYEPDKFIMNEKDAKLFLLSQNINIKRLYSLLHQNSIEELFIETVEAENKDGVEIIFDKKAQSLQIKSCASEISSDIVYNIPPIPPYLQVQIKTNPVLKILSELSVINHHNLSALRALNVFKIILDGYLKIALPAERMKMGKKNVGININDNLVEIQLLQLFDVLSKITYANQIR